MSMNCYRVQLLHLEIRRCDQYSISSYHHIYGFNKQEETAVTLERLVILRPMLTWGHACDQHP